jgi:PEP-CTERM/exosortase A-associated glycosyltransferase
MSLRILHVLDHSIPLHSGYTFRTRAILQAQQQRGWTVRGLTTPRHVAENSKDETIDGLDFVRTPAPKQTSGIGLLNEMNATTAKLLQEARAWKPDIIHAHSPALNGIPALRVGKALGIPVVYEIRAFWEDAAVDHGTTTEGSLRYRLTRAMETYVIKRAQAVTTICEGLRKDIVGRGVSEQKVTVIPNAVDAKAFTRRQPADDVLQRQLKLDDAAVLGFLGSYYAYEGLDLLIASMPEVVRRVPNAKALLVGGGPQEANLKAQAVALGMADHVIFVGRVPHAEVHKYYDLVDVLVYPRHRMRLTDLVTPLKPLEAMAQEHIVLASDVGGHHELIEDGKTGFLFRADDQNHLVRKLTEMLADRESWNAVRLNGRRFVEDVRNWTNSVARYETVYANARATRHA